MQTSVTREPWKPVHIELGLPPLPQTGLALKVEQAKVMNKPDLKEQLKLRGLYKNTMTEESMVSWCAPLTSEYYN